MFVKHSNEGYTTPIEGIDLKPLAHGEKTLLTRFHMKKGADLPSHSHTHEQTGFLVSGKIVLSIGDREFAAGPGDSWSIPGNMVHRARVVEDAVAIEVFSPVREEYLTLAAMENS